MRHSFPVVRQRFKRLFGKRREDGGSARRRDFPVVDLTALDLLTPLDALRRANGCPFLFDCAVDDLRGPDTIGFPFSVGSGLHPFVLASIWLDSGESPRPVESPLKIYYELVRPGSAAEKLGLVSSSYLSTLPALAARPPWSTVLPGAKAIKRAEKAARKESVAHGFAPSGERFNITHGPVPSEILEREHHRLATLLKSVAASGFDKSDPPRVTLLVGEGGDARAVVDAGQHRVAVCSALGYEAVPVLVRGVVHRSEVEEWPGVVYGVFTVEEALSVFDRVFGAIPPSCITEVWPPERAGCFALPRGGRS